jgi:hypothetical protein
MTLDAIHAHLAALYPEQAEPLTFHTNPTLSEGGQHILDEVLVFRASEPVPHWHYVSAGLSDIDDYRAVQHLPRLNENGELLSGLGEEFTFRLADSEAINPENMPPHWPAMLLQQLAKQVHASSEPLVPGSLIVTGKPLVSGVETGLTALSFTEDPELASLTTDSGKLAFIQVLALTSDEAKIAAEQGAESITSLLLGVIPSGITDLARQSVLELIELDPDPAA